MSDFLNGIEIRIKNTSLQTKLIAIFVTLIFIPVMILTLYSYSKSSRVITAQTEDISSLYLSQKQNEVETEISKLVKAAQIISQNNELREYLLQDGKTLSFSDEYDIISDIDKNLNSILQLYSPSSIRIYIDSDFRYSQRKYFTFDINDVKDEDWFTDMRSENKNIILRPPYSFRRPLLGSVELISIVIPIRSYKNINELLGMVSVDMEVSALQKIITPSEHSKFSGVMLLDSKNNPVCQSGDFPEASKDLIAKALDAYRLEPGSLSDNSSSVSVSAAILGSWRLCAVTSISDMLEENRILRNQLITFTVIVTVLVLLIAVVYSHYSSKRVRELAHLMRKADKGDFTVKCVVDSGDEIGELQSSFNIMIGKINDLLKERYNIGKSLKETELKALQAQINPHFLYNTLDLISWKAQIGGNPEISDIVCKMARFYQLSLSNGSDFIRLADEFEHIRLYVELQNLRMKYQMELKTDLAPAAADFLIMKLILQPIVENSITHGLSDIEHGIIKIGAALDGEYLLITVADNGSGMSKSQLTAIRSHNCERQIKPTGHGFGLLNILDRLKVYYNDNYAFDISSEVGVGTTVSIRIPTDSENKSFPKQST